MPQKPLLSTLVGASSSDAFGVLIYDSDAPRWNAAAELVAADDMAQTSSLFVTSSGGEITQQQSRQLFFSIPHSESALTVSADWGPADMIDGYVTGTFKYDGRVAQELFQYGPLETKEARFLDLLFVHFIEISRSCSRALLAIDASGASEEIDWRSVFEDGDHMPATVDIVAVSHGAFQIHSANFEKVFEGEGVELYSRIRT